MKRMIFNLQEFHKQVRDRMSLWKEKNYMGRLMKKDPALWFPGPQPEITDRLGWLDLPGFTPKKLDEFYAFRDDVMTEHFSYAVLCGMGGSSLAPEFFQRTFGNAPGNPELLVLDSTHPLAIHSVEQRIDLEESLFIISSKSGTTLETLSLFRYFWNKIEKASKRPGRQFVAITDPGTPLEAMAKERGFRKVFLAPSDVGGRYSALTDFGLVPAALIGLDVHRFLEKAKYALESYLEDVTEERASCLFLGAALGELCSSRDKLTVLASPSLSHFPDWLEQLVAESTGKDGKGIIPVVNEALIPAENYGSDRFFAAFFLEADRDEKLGAHMKRVEEFGHPSIRIELKEKYGLAQEIFRWEVAVASAGSILGIHPFNQPDVQLAKDLARKAMEGKGNIQLESVESGSLRIEDKGLDDSFSAWLEEAKPGDYVCIQAYLPPTSEVSAAVQGFRMRLLNRTRLASSAGFGPRFLHSTGQLHKGGPNSGLFLQLVDKPSFDLAVPETDYTFSSLIQAQAVGDFLALREMNRRVLRVNLGDDSHHGIQQLEELI